MEGAAWHDGISRQLGVEKRHTSWFDEQQFNPKLVLLIVVVDVVVFVDDT